MIILFYFLIAQSWHMTEVDSAAGASLTNINFDTLGIPHIAYGCGVDFNNVNLRLAFDSIGIWQTKLIDTNIITISMDYSPLTGLWISCIDTNQYLKIWNYIDTLWQMEYIDSSFKFSLYSHSIDLNSSGLPALAINDENFTEVWFYSYDGNSWHKEVVDSLNDPLLPSLDFDANDMPHIAYHKRRFETNRELWYAKKITSIWEYELVDTNLEGGAQVVVRLNDSSNLPSILYAGGSVGGWVRYAFNSGSVWERELVSMTSNHITSITFEFNDTIPNIAYTIDGLGIRYGERISDNWYIEPIIFQSGIFYGISLKINPDTEPCVSFTPPLNYVCKTENIWEVIKDDICGDYSCSHYREGMVLISKRNSTLFIFDVTGRIVAKKSFSHDGKYFINLDAGIYFLMIRTNDQIVRKKVIIL